MAPESLADVLCMAYVHVWLCRPMSTVGPTGQQTNNLHCFSKEVLNMEILMVHDPQRIGIKKCTMPNVIARLVSCVFCYDLSTVILNEQT